MRGVDQHVDAFAGEIIGKPGSAAKAAAAHGHRLRRRRRGTAGQRQRHAQIFAPGQASGQLPRFRSAAENKDACHVCF